MIFFKKWDNLYNYGMLKPKLKVTYPCNYSAPCLDAVIQLDLFNSQFNEVVGCKKLTKTEWNKGLKNFETHDKKQTNCPLLKGLPNDPEENT